MLPRLFDRRRTSNSHAQFMAGLLDKRISKPSWVYSRGKERTFGARRTHSKGIMQEKTIGINI